MVSKIPIKGRISDIFEKNCPKAMKAVNIGAVLNVLLKQMPDWQDQEKKQEGVHIVANTALYYMKAIELMLAEGQ